jgi:TRAP-type C4-dicarboxylate transport system substrate-binding protein
MAVCLVLCVVTGASAAAAQETIKLHVIAAQPPRMLTVAMLSRYMLPEINKRLKERGSNYQIDWRESYAGVVAGNTETFAAIQNRIGDMGQVGTLFEAAKLPLSQLTFFVPFTGANVEEVLEVTAKLHDEVPELNKGFARFGQRVLGLMGTDSYYLVTNFPVNSFDDLKGRKLGLPGSAANWVKGTGAVPVSTTVSEYYNSIKTGVYDGVIVFASGIVPFKLHEVAPYITDIGMGAMLAGAQTINEAVYQGLPTEVREVLDEVGKDYQRQLGVEGVKEAKEAVEKAAKLGAKVSVLSAKERVRWADAMPNITKEWAEAQEARGLPARRLVSLYVKALKERRADLARDWTAGWGTD